MRTYCVLLFAIIFNDVFCENPKKVIHKMTQQLGQAVLDCQKEVEFEQAIIVDFLNFWDPRYQLRHGELGCVFLCALLTLELVDGREAPIETNVLAFARANYAGKRANYADDFLARQILGFYELCRANRTLPPRRDHPCAAGWSQALCLRRTIIFNHLAPQPGAVYDDADYN